MFPLVLLLSLAAPDAPPKPIPWNACLRQSAAWYASDEALRIADLVLLYQRDTGGWPKNIEMSEPLDAKAEAVVRAAKKVRTDSTIDNGATHTQLTYLANVFAATKDERCRDGFRRGLDYLLSGQYPNGGWPQFWPGAKGYLTHITFNDDAMTSVLTLLSAIAARAAPFGEITSPEQRARAKAAVDKGTACILACQVVVAGQKTGWCAQHDQHTLAPAPARSYELVSLSGAEGVSVVRYLMSIERPSAEVIAAVKAAAAWFEAVKIQGIKVVEKPDPKLPKGYDRVVVADPQAPPLWARFYQIGTNRPIFCGRDGVIRASLAEIEHERRIGYAWYTNRAQSLLEREYPAWREKWGAR